jgi:hypothetical protein
MVSESAVAVPPVYLVKVRLGVGGGGGVGGGAGVGAGAGPTRRLPPFQTFDGTPGTVQSPSQQPPPFVLGSSHSHTSHELFWQHKLRHASALPSPVAACRSPPHSSFASSKVVLYSGQCGVGPGAGVGGGSGVSEHTAVMLPAENFRFPHFA